MGVAGAVLRQRYQPHAVARAGGLEESARLRPLSVLRGGGKSGTGGPPQTAPAAAGVPSLVGVSAQGQPPTLTTPGSSGGRWGGYLLETAGLRPLLSTLGGGVVGGGRTGGAPLTIPAAARMPGVVKSAAQPLSGETLSPPAKAIAGVRHNE